jgi:hypothetical protein
MRRWSPYLWLFVLAALIAAVVYWWYTDWWAYYYPGGDPNPRPKFIMPWWWQFGESAVVGVLAATPLVGLAWLVGSVWSRLTKRFS